MSNIEELNSRIMAALDKIGNGVSTLAEKAKEPGGPSPELEAALEEEKLANAQLEERLRALRARHDDELLALRAELDKGAELEKLRGDLEQQALAMGKLDMDVQRLRMANDQLRASNAALREANEAGVGEPHLINKAMLAELEGLRAARATDVAEANAILAKLEPLVSASQSGEGA